MRLMRNWAVCLLFVLGAPAAIAQEKSTEKSCILQKTLIETELPARDAKGRKISRLAAVDKIEPGAVAVYTVSAANICEHPVERVSIDLAVPEHMIYLAKTAVGPGTEVTFSVDGGFNYAKPEALYIKDADGKLRKAEPKDYTHIRWVMRKSLRPGAVAFARFRAKLE